MSDSNQNQPVSTAVYAFVAPVNREASSPTIFDPSRAAEFDIAAPGAPWTSIGRIENLQRTAADEASSVQMGVENAVVAQFRKKLEAHVSFDMRHWNKLTMAIASGGAHFNVLESEPGAPPAAIGGEGKPSVPVRQGSTATLLKFDADAVSHFAPGDLLAIDADYQQQLGYVGLGMSAAYVASSQAVHSSVDFIRRLTFNIGRVASVTGGDVSLQAPLLAGAPPSGAAAQKVVGFADREGGAFRQEWSMLFVEESAYGGRVFYYYPRLQSVPPGSERRRPIAGDYEALLLQAHMLALPVADPQDGVGALWYRAYVPPSGS